MDCLTGWPLQLSYRSQCSPVSPHEVSVPVPHGSDSLPWDIIGLQALKSRADPF